MELKILILLLLVSNYAVVQMMVDFNPTNGISRYHNRNIKRTGRNIFYSIKAGFH